MISIYKNLRKLLKQLVTSSYMLHVLAKEVVNGKSEPMEH